MIDQAKIDTLPGAPDITILEFRRSNLRCILRPSETILEVAIAAGILVAHSCERGTCGLCETRVLEGEPDHRDRVLSRAERAEGQTIMICCSRSRTPLLALDI